MTDEDTEIYGGIKIRWMMNRDLNSVIKIENKVYEYSWTKDEFEKQIKQKNCIGLVALLDDEVIGYIVYDIYDSYYEILNIAIDAKHRRTRIATMLVNRILRKLDTDAKNTVLVCVREKNLAAQLFFRKQEFICTEILDNYYHTDEPAYLMEFKLNDKQITNT